jgi:hypothetical protein
MKFLWSPPRKLLSVGTAAALLVLVTMNAALATEDCEENGDDWEARYNVCVRNNTAEITRKRAEITRLRTERTRLNSNSFELIAYPELARECDCAPGGPNCTRGTREVRGQEQTVTTAAVSGDWPPLNADGSEPPIRGDGNNSCGEVSRRGVSRLSQTCREEVNSCRGTVKTARLATIETLIEEAQTSIDDLNAKNTTLRADLRRGTCTTCNQRRTAQSSNRPGVGDYIVGGLQAISPMVTSGINAYMYNQGLAAYGNMYGQGLNAYNSNYNGYLQQCATLGVPCQGPLMQGPGGGMIGGGMMMGGGMSTGGGMMNPMMMGGGMFPGGGMMNPMMMGGGMFPGGGMMNPMMMGGGMFPGGGMMNPMMMGGGMFPGGGLSLNLGGGWGTPMGGVPGGLGGGGMMGPYGGGMMGPYGGGGMMGPYGGGGMMGPYGGGGMNPYGDPGSYQQMMAWYQQQQGQLYQQQAAAQGQSDLMIATQQFYQAQQRYQQSLTYGGGVGGPGRPF